MIPHALILLFAFLMTPAVSAPSYPVQHSPYVVRRQKCSVYHCRWPKQLVSCECILNHSPSPGPFAGTTTSARENRPENVSDGIGGTNSTEGGPRRADDSGTSTSGGSNIGGSCAQHPGANGTVETVVGNKSEVHGSVGTNAKAGIGNSTRGRNSSEVVEKSDNVTVTDTGAGAASNIGQSSTGLIDENDGDALPNSTIQAEPRKASGERYSNPHRRKAESDIGATSCKKFDCFWPKELIDCQCVTKSPGAHSSNSTGKEGEAGTHTGSRSVGRAGSGGGTGGGTGTGSADGSSSSSFSGSSSGSHSPSGGGGGAGAGGGGGGGGRNGHSHGHGSSSSHGRGRGAGNFSVGGGNAKAIAGGGGQTNNSVAVGSGFGRAAGSGFGRGTLGGGGQGEGRGGGRGEGHTTAGWPR